MRHLLQTTINVLLSAGADAVVREEWSKPSSGRLAQRNGYRLRELDTRAVTIDVAIPKLRQGTDFPEGLVERRKRVDAAMSPSSRTPTSPGLHPPHGQAREDLGHPLPVVVTGLRMATDLDQQVASFRIWPLVEEGPSTFAAAADALTMKVREAARVINEVVMVATGVNADGLREVPWGARGDQRDQGGIEHVLLRPGGPGLPGSADAPTTRRT